MNKYLLMIVLSFQFSALVDVILFLPLLDYFLKLE
jgi:hypothetical protein